MTTEQKTLTRVVVELRGHVYIVRDWTGEADQLDFGRELDAMMCRVEDEDCEGK